MKEDEMKKSEIWAEAQKNIETVIASNSDSFKKDKSSLVHDELMKVFKELLGPKNESRTNEYPDYICEDTKKTMHYCTWHKVYEDITDFNTKNAKAVNECKEAIKHWHKYAKDIAKHETIISNILDRALDEEITMSEAKEIRLSENLIIAELKQKRLDKIDYAGA